MARFFLDAKPVDGQATIVGDDARHIQRVLRLRSGAEIEVVVDGCAYRAQVVRGKPGEVVVAIGDPIEMRSESPLPVHLYQALPKGGKMDLIIQKATELGAVSITPLLTRRVIVKLKPTAVANKLQHWQRVAAAAAKQTRRLVIPQVLAPMQLGELPSLPPDHLGLVAWEEEKAALRPLLRARDYKAVHVLIGPEGGLQAAEIADLRDKGWRSASLGPRILRTETAPLALIAILQYELGDIGGNELCPG